MPESASKRGGKRPNDLDRMVAALRAGGHSATEDEIERHLQAIVEQPQEIVRAMWRSALEEEQRKLAKRTGQHFKGGH